MQTNRKEYRRNYYLANKERITENNRKYYLANRERILAEQREYRRNYYLANKEDILENNRKYYLANKERILERNRNYYLANKEHILVRTKKNNKKQYQQNESIRKYQYRSRCLRRNGTLQALLLRDGNNCLCCGVSFGETKPTIDHIIPMSRGGTDDLENLQMLCAPCNARKGNRIICYRKR